MTVDQVSFTKAILDPNLQVPHGLTDPQGRTAGKRFSVYRNNVAVSLTEALQMAFPVIRKLVGDEFFHAMAGVFLRQHPPSSALMMFYGDQMPGFLEKFEPVSHLGYLPDMARLELAIRQSYHAADSQPINPAQLQELSADALMQSRFELAPAVRLVRSRWPIHAIWLANTIADAPAPVMAAQDVLVARPEFDPQLMLLGAGGADFIGGLRQGLTFENALSACDADIDLSAALGQLLAGHSITKITA